MLSKSWLVGTSCSTWPSNTPDKQRPGAGAEDLVNGHSAWHQTRWRPHCLQKQISSSKPVGGPTYLVGGEGPCACESHQSISVCMRQVRCQLPLIFFPFFISCSLSSFPVLPFVLITIVVVSSSFPVLPFVLITIVVVSSCCFLHFVAFVFVLWPFPFPSD